MSELNLKHFLFQVIVWIVVAVGVLSFQDPFGFPRALLGSLLLTLFLGFVTFKLCLFLNREQRLIATGVTLSSAVILLLLAVKFYLIDFELKALHFIGIFLLPLVVSALAKDWRNDK
jgi:1,4-dihydroxy-2-naphthoate octaprenyltransferase